uniref:Uncharacterized protein n=1 Tax=Arundo donax TaxID=35708 RepID=A0A0A9GHB3_ARUDO
MSFKPSKGVQAQRSTSAITLVVLYDILCGLERFVAQ